MWSPSGPIASSPPVQGWSVTGPTGPDPEPVTDWFNTGQATGFGLSALTGPGGLKVKLNAIVDSDLALSNGTPKLYLPGFVDSVQVDSASASFSPMAPVLTTFTNTASQLNYTIPPWARYVDIVMIGGGASGRTGNGAINATGKGGMAGARSWVTAEVNPAYPVIQLWVGKGGAQAANSDAAESNPGTDSWAGFNNGATLSAAGGPNERSDNNQDGESSAGGTYNGVSYAGGNGGTGNGGAGQAPGGGGAGGKGGFFGSRTRGGAGADGRVWIRAYQ